MGNGDYNSNLYKILSKEAKIKNNVNDDPVVAFADEILWQSIKIHASDIHLQPDENEIKIRVRLDGTLYDHGSIDLNRGLAVISRIKILSSLDIAEKRFPQDGKFHAVFEDENGDSKKIDFRISTFPSIYGEKIVIRILDRSTKLLELDKLGFNENVFDQIKNILNRPHGLFLVTGPTGSGKTTTLYAMLSHLNKPNVNIVTMEDPVEYNLDGVTQSQINLKTGFSFENGLRSILRQDPDIIMIGEIRDKLTLQIAIESALTGHLVFSTLHTNNAAGAVTRLLEMGAEPFLINAALIGVLAQRLVRKTCKACRQSPIDACVNCMHTGYKGRLGIFELLGLDESFHPLILEKTSATNLHELALKNGMISMYQDGLQKIQAKLTTLEELLAATQAETKR